MRHWAEALPKFGRTPVNKDSEEAQRNEVGEGYWENVNPWNRGEQQLVIDQLRSWGKRY